METWLSIYIQVITFYILAFILGFIKKMNGIFVNGWRFRPLRQAITKINGKCPLFAQLPRPSKRKFHYWFFNDIFTSKKTQEVWWFSKKKYKNEARRPFSEKYFPRNGALKRLFLLFLFCSFQSPGVKRSYKYFILVWVWDLFNVYAYK